MDPFTLQRSLFRVLTDARPSIAEGMNLVLDRVAGTRSGKPWEQCRDLDWERGLERWTHWFSRLLVKHPPPRETELLWFEVPSEINPSLTSVSGYAKLASSGEGFGMAEGRTWPVDRRGFTLPAGLHRLPELDEGLRRVGWRDTDEEELKRLSPGVYAVSHAYATLLVINGLPKTRVFSRIDSYQGVAVVVGWTEGDAQAVGQLRPSGWSGIRRVRPSTEPKEGELNPWSYRFNLKKYIAAGRDINARDRDGATILMHSQYDSVDRIRLLLAAGADVRPVDNEGRNALHWFSAAELPVLRLLLDAGANPNRVARNGWSVMDCVVWDGRCTLAHIKLLNSRGAKLRHLLRGRNTPLHDLAASSFGEAGERASASAMIRFWLRRYGIESRRSDGLTPLWVALRAHAANLDERLRWIRRGLDASDLGNYRHDQTAMMLLKHGADPNGVYDGPKQRFIPARGTPLMLQRYDNDRLVRALLRHGADPGARCAKGRTALDYARAALEKGGPGSEGAGEVVAVLERAVRRAKRG